MLNLVLLNLRFSKIFSFSFFGRGRGFYLRSVAPPSPKPSLVRCGDIALLTQSVAGFQFAFSGCGSRRVKFEAEIYKFDFKFEFRN